MSNTAEQVAQMVNMLPASEQLFALEFIKRLMLAWDPDFSKATTDEATSHAAAAEEIQHGEVVRHEDIDWDAPPVVQV